MRNNFRFMSCLAAIAMGFALAPAAMRNADAAPPSSNFVDRRRGKGMRYKRGTGLQSKPKRRSNRLIVSKRVRRKHRRAA